MRLSKEELYRRDKERKGEYAKEHKAWLDNASPEQKALWEREKKFHYRHEKRDEYFEVFERLRTFVPPAPPRSQGGKHGRIVTHVHEDGDLEGVKMHLVRRMF